MFDRPLGSNPARIRQIADTCMIRSRRFCLAICAKLRLWSLIRIGIGGAKNDGEILLHSASIKNGTRIEMNPTSPGRSITLDNSTRAFASGARRFEYSSSASATVLLD